MVLGNRKTLSFDSKKIKALQNKIQGILQVINAPAKIVAPKRNAKPRARKQPSSEESSSESDSSSSSDSSSDSRSEDGLIPEGERTPTLPPRNVPVLTAAENDAKDLLAAKKLLLEAQQRVAALASVSLNYDTPTDQPSGPALKAPAPPAVVLSPTINAAPRDYSIPKKSVMLEKADSQHSRKSKPSKGAKKAAKRAHKLSKKGRKHAKKHAKKTKRPKKARKASSSETESSSSESCSGSSSESPHPKDDQAHQVSCSVCCKNTAQVL